MKFQFPTTQTPILVQGITSELGPQQLNEALEYGTHIVAGVSHDIHYKKIHGVPLYSSVKRAIQHHPVYASVIFSTPVRALDDVRQAIEAKIPLIILTTEHIPMHDALKIRAMAEKSHITLLGPSSAGLINVDECLIGTLPKHLFTIGNVAIIGRSASLMYEAVQQLKQNNLGISKCVSLGADHLISTSFVPIVESLLTDRKTKNILIIGQVHGQLEYELAQYLQHKKNNKNMFVYIPGKSLLKSDKYPLLGMNSVLFSDVISNKYAQLSKSHVHIIESVDQIGSRIFKIIKDKK